MALAFRLEKRCFAKGATVIVAARSRDKAQIALKKLFKETKKNKIDFVELDLSDLTQISQVVCDLTSKFNDWIYSLIMQE